ncbi:MAG: hypothetical protein NXH85_00375 [Pseudomonadaceae bacterium]|nr:hypothetical protein [Pseudomonadaceae bacterium]
MISGLAVADWLVIAGYLTAMLLLAASLGRRQKSGGDYFLGGGQLSSRSLAASTIATQCSTNSLLGAPAFVGFSAGGGLLWLQYELAVPLAMAALMFILLPARALGITSIYEVVERNIGRDARLLASGTFLLFRGVATGVTIYGVGLIITAIVEIDYATAVALVMVVVIIYDVLGGLRAVVISDVIQLLLLTATVLISLVLIADVVGWAAFFEQRTDTLVSGWGVEGDSYSFWPMLIGGLFLYAAYYGADQSQAQRVLAAPDTRSAGRVLLYNGLFRFPLVLSYCLLGLGLAAFAAVEPGLVQRLPATASGSPNYNLVFPAFVLSNFAPGFIGLVIVGLLAAAMSSIDSAINSLSAATVEDFIQPRLTQPLTNTAALRLSRLVTVAWGFAAVLFSFQVEHIAPTVLEAINKVGSMANGSLLALIASATLLRHLKQRAAIIGFGAGIAVNLVVATLLPSVSWLWWNVIGFAVAAGTTVRLSGVRVVTFRQPGLPQVKLPLVLLAAMFALILLITALLDRLA